MYGSKTAANLQQISVIHKFSEYYFPDGSLWAGREADGRSRYPRGRRLPIETKKLLKTHATTCALSPAPALGADISQSLLFAGILIVPDVPAVILVRLEESRCDAGI